MTTFKYYLTLLISRITGEGNYKIIKELRREGMKIGEGTYIFTNLASSEPFLVEIGNNCTISTEVNFITHDASIGVFEGREVFTDLVGKIVIGDNCFLGAGTLILPGVTLGNNTIVAAGSIVTKSFEGNVVIGGNPARIITDINKYREKIANYALNINGLSSEERKILLMTTDKLIKK